MTNITNHVAKMPLLAGSSIAEKRSEFKLYFNQTWELYESLFALINCDTAYLSRPEPLRHPLIFYFGHTATFYINKLNLGNFIDQRVNSHIESICAIGVDEMSWDDLNTDHYNWPTVAQLKAYRDEVRTIVNSAIDTMPIVLPLKRDTLAWVILMGIEHERIHIETSSVIMRMLPLEQLTPNEAWAACPYSAQAPDNELVTIDRQMITLGKPVTDATYGWDNEYGSKVVDVDQFKTSKYLVSNKEFLSFVEQGGYQQMQFWTEEGKKWQSFSQATMPRFWLQRNGQYYQRNLLEEIKLPLNWPVEINYLEAKAFCNWLSQTTNSNVRLPTESEWMCLRNKLNQDLLHWSEAPGNLNLEYFASPCPVDKFEIDGIYDIIGNVWQWTESPFDGFTGFKVHPLYDDFSTPTFDGQHNLIKGGSWMSTGNEAQKHSRYAFRRHFFQHAGFRYVQSNSEHIPIDEVNTFESNVAVAQQLELHYADLENGKGPLGLQNYIFSCVQTCLPYFKRPQSCRALDLGCSVGRSSFELARHFAHVDAIDVTARLIQHGFLLQEQGESRYVVKAEGEIVSFKNINISKHPFSAVKQKIIFSQGDACNLKPQYTGYDLIFCANLLERLNDPESFLRHIDNRLNAQGYLVLASNYQWSDPDKMNSKILGGVKVNGENFTTLDGLKQLLCERFDFVNSSEIPYLLHQSNRQHQLNYSELSVWRLKQGEHV